MNHDFRDRTYRFGAIISMCIYCGLSQDFAKSFKYFNCDKRPTDGLEAPTHRCKICNALWRKLDDGSWNLRSFECGQCCDNVSMNKQIESLDAEEFISTVKIAEHFVFKRDLDL